LFVALRYTSYVQHQQLEERKRQPPPTYQPPPPPPQMQEGPNYDAATAGGRDLGSELLAGEGVSLG
jgi:hypothetical protein